MREIRQIQKKIRIGMHLTCKYKQNDLNSRVCYSRTSQHGWQDRQRNGPAEAPLHLLLSGLQPPSRHTPGYSPGNCSTTRPSVHPHPSYPSSGSPHSATCPPSFGPLLSALYPSSGPAIPAPYPSYSPALAWHRIASIPDC